MKEIKNLWKYFILNKLINYSIDMSWSWSCIMVCFKMGLRHNMSPLTTTTSLVKFDSWTPRMEAKTFTNKLLHLLWTDITMHSIYPIIHLKCFININFEVSYFINILSKWNNKKFFWKFFQNFNYLFLKM
jgi:hypothetical protein